MPRPMIALLLLLVACPASAQSDPPPCLELSTWTSIAAPTRIPASGTCDLTGYEYLAGYLGLRPFYNGGGGDWSQGIAEFFWTRDSAGDQIATEQPVTLHAGIQSLGQFSFPNLTNHVYVLLQPINGQNATAMSMRGSHTLSLWPAIPGDSMLITASGTFDSTGHATIYPADYWAGPTQIYLSGGTGIDVFQYDLTYQQFTADTHGPGTFVTVTQMGTWGVFARGTPGSPYAITATPMLTGGLVR